MASKQQDSSHLFGPTHPRRLIPELCRHFYQQGWFSGTGGGISIKHGDKIYVAPSGVQKERLDADDLFMLNSDGSVVHKPPEDRKLTLSQCTPLFMNAYQDRKAKAVLHSHGKYSVLASLIYPGSEFKVKNLEMIKGIHNPVLGRMFRYDEELVIPIIENTCFEADLKDEMKRVMRLYPQSNAILVRRHGIYVWGDSWQQCKTQAESYHYLLEVAVEMEKLGLNEYTHDATTTNVSMDTSVTESTPAKTATPSTNKTTTTTTKAVAKTTPKKDAVVANGTAKATPAAKKDAVTPKTPANTPNTPKSAATTPSTSGSPAKKAGGDNKKNSSNTGGVKGGKVAKRGGKNQRMMRGGGRGRGGRGGPPRVFSPGSPPLMPGPPMMMGPPMGPPMMFNMQGGPMPRGGGRGGPRGGARGGKRGQRGGGNKRGGNRAAAQQKQVLMNY